MTPFQATLCVYNPDFLARVRFFLMKAAVNVASEPENTPNHAARLSMAKEILADDDFRAALAKDVALAVMTFPANLSRATVEEIPDSDLEFTVNAVYNAFL